MATDSRTGRQEAWRTLVQRGVDTAAELSDVVAQKLGAAADPRAKLLRKRRWALRAALFFTFSTGLNKGHEAAPLIVDNTMFIVTPYPNILYALDLTKPGAPLKWQYQPKPAPARALTGLPSWRSSHD